MLPLFTGELATFQGTQESAMHDTCVILTATVTTDRYGKPVKTTYAAGPEIPCGFRQGGQAGAGTNEVMAETEVVTADAVLRLAVDTVITSRDRVVVTHRYGVAVPLQAYGVLGQPARGPSALLVELELVTDGSSQ
jgi:hypothetical protein